MKTLENERMNLSLKIESHCVELGIKATCPYDLSNGSDVVRFAAYLPHFGSGRGLLINEVCEPDFATSEPHRLVAERENIPISFVNPLSIVNQREFIEALQDWGYFGDIVSAPSFMQMRGQGRIIEH
ncbi:hypothetical protein HUX88_22870 [Duganella sp. BJB1802]|uniref:hypothetical protein n=1 Tax=Duganella sp. BJB1802 TaxID=2744575 RepID=UPI001593175E|nr:hypothetical protein [Duganella sp. BJB1802]NVD73357.1 hypothetical protein [Duganella sp. BJB1802]